jgi:hypothetical protein
MMQHEVVGMLSHHPLWENLWVTMELNSKCLSKNTYYIVSRVIEWHIQKVFLSEQT